MRVVFLQHGAFSMLRAPSRLIFPCKSLGNLVSCKCVCSAFSFIFHIYDTSMGCLAWAPSYDYFLNLVYSQCNSAQILNGRSRSSDKCTHKCPFGFISPEGSLLSPSPVTTPSPSRVLLLSSKLSYGRSMESHSMNFVFGSFLLT